MITIAADAQILTQWEHNAANPNLFTPYFYVHDRLGSVRMVVEYDGTNDVVETVNSYTYTPFGQFYGTVDETVDNPWTFTGQWYDAEIAQYYLRARMYDPTMMRFTSRDPVKGKFEKPLTVHKYLYCLNDPIDRTDPSGRYALQVTSAITTGAALYAHGINLATYAVSSDNWKFFDLAESTFKFMPIGMAVASTGLGALTPGGKLAGWVTGWALEEVTHMTGMGRIEGFGMNFFASIMYGSYVLHERASLGIWADDWDGFLEWRGPW